MRRTDTGTVSAGSQELTSSGTSMAWSRAATTKRSNPEGDSGSTSMGTWEDIVCHNFFSPGQHISLWAPFAYIFSFIGPFWCAWYISHGLYFFCVCIYIYNQSILRRTYGSSTANHKCGDQTTKQQHINKIHLHITLSTMATQLSSQLSRPNTTRITLFKGNGILLEMM